MAQTREDAATMELKSCPFSENSSSISQEIEDIFSENGQTFYPGYLSWVLVKDVDMVRLKYI